jgi:inosine/xanthosine triphosphatase
MSDSEQPRRAFVNVVVGSMNEAKISAARIACTAVFGQVSVSGVSVSHTPDQPVTDAQTLAGAEHRAGAARLAWPGADYWLGIEGGVEHVAGELMVFAWIIALGAEGTGRSRSSTYQLPQFARSAVESGHALGEVSAQVRGPDWRKVGLVASLSGGLVTRSDIYVQPIILALLPFRDNWRSAVGPTSQGPT